MAKPNKAEDTMITVATQFSKFPGGRFRTDGTASGERFREDFLVPALKKNGKVTVNMDGTLGFGSSFLEEAFGGLVREEGFEQDKLRRDLVIETTNESLNYTVWRYINDATPPGRTAN